VSTATASTPLRPSTPSPYVPPPPEQGRRAPSASRGGQGMGHWSRR
jgi:hypothetical protein